MILFYSNLLEEDIDLDLFLNQLDYNMICINNLLDEVWDELLKKIDENKNENIIKTYYFSLKRFHKLLFSLKSKIYNLNNYKLIENITNILEEIQNKIYLIRDNKFKIKSGQYSKQFINEEEYSLLLEDINKES
jgi:hypothetical protein